MAIAQDNRSETIDIYDEREELRSTAITIISIMIVIGSPILGNLVQSSADNWLLEPWIALEVSGLLALFLNSRNRTLSGIILTSSIWLVITLQQIGIAYNPGMLYLLILPVILGLIFFKLPYVPILPVITIIVLLLIESVANQPLSITPDMLFISILSIAVAVAGYALLEHSQNMVQWALESQNKNFVRAESFYDQGEQLLQTTYELEKAKEKVEEISGAKSAFLSNMSHELRTPLNMVIGYTSSILDMPQMYENQEIPEIFRNDIGLIKSSGEYLLTLINDILDLSKIESGKFDINLVAFELAPILEGVMATALGLVKEKSIQLKPNYDTELPLLWGDPMRIRQILLNLMSNAVKYTLTGSVILSVEQRGEELFISVTDTGMGIPEGTISSIFDRFEQVQNKSEIQGTGLGLDISQRLAQMHGSEITIESTIGVGSTFGFALSLATAEQISNFKGDETIHELTGIKRFDTETVDNTWESKRTVLIAEDDSVTRDMLIRTFKAHNYVVFDVQDGDDVYETASALLPELIILDIVLPNRDGWEILDELKADEETGDIPVIVLSAHIDNKQQNNSKAHVCLPKPINMQTILKHADAAITQNDSTKLEA